MHDALHQDAIHDVICVSMSPVSTSGWMQRSAGLVDSLIVSSKNDVQESYHRSIGTHDVRGWDEMVPQLKPAELPFPNWEVS